MAKKNKSAAAVTSEPESRLDRVARDLSRTLLHGARVKDTAGQTKPASIATGQQIRVDLPDQGPMNFRFTVGGVGRPVAISHDDAVHSKSVMSAVTDDQTKAKYLTLNADGEIPTWVFQQREFSLPNQPAPEDKVDKVGLPDPSAPAPGIRTLRIVKLPSSSLPEVGTKGSSVSLWSFDPATHKGKPFPEKNWQPAILLQFPLQIVPGATPIFEIQGTPQGDRYYLDQLLDPRDLQPGSGIFDAPEIFGIALMLEKKDNAGKPVREQIAEWTIARTNLTEQARAGATSQFAADRAAALPARPYVALSNGGVDQDKDAVRLLQMASITNSGGYYLRAKTNLPDASALILSIALKAKLDPDPDNSESGALPAAANALAYLDGTQNPDTIRFNGLDHIHAVPLAPPGVLSFGWTRNEPEVKSTDEDKFGYGSVSLVEYSAQDASGQFLVDANTGFAISPMGSQTGDHFERFLPSGVSEASGGVHNLHTGTSAAMRLLAPHHIEAAKRPRKNALAAGDTLRYYRTTLASYNEKAKESPYWRFRDPLRRQITFTPGFRDVFGNRFEALPGAIVQRKLFYTDAVIAPAEWPGVRFSLYPGSQGSNPVLFLEMSYRLLHPTEDKASRLKRLGEIRIQLQGVNADVAVSLRAEHLLKSAAPIDCSAIVGQLSDWMLQEENNHSEPLNPLVKTFAAIPCDGKIDAAVQFRPTLQVSRTNPDYCPRQTDLPSDPTLSKLIGEQVTFATSVLTLTASPTLPKSILDLRNPHAGKDEPLRKDEFRPIAEAFQNNLADPLNMQVGFLRDRANQHELWLIPNSFLPVEPDRNAYVPWSFATARPLKNSLGTDDLLVPDFSTTCSNPSTTDCWRNHPLIKQRVVDQDFDQLGRIALSLIERETSGPDLLTARESADAMRSVLSARESIAKGLAVFDGGTGVPYLIPLLAAPVELDTAAITRTGADAFLRSLNAFYTVDTIVQLPLASAGSPGIAMFEGSVDATFAAAAPKLPAFSDILLRGGERKVTILYDLPPSTTSYTGVPAIATLTAKFSHVQLPDASGGPAFNPGLWVELVEPWQLVWKGSPEPVPVAVRAFPPKPAITSTETMLPWTDPTTGDLPVPPMIDASTVSLLVQWGWKFSFSIEGLPNDTVHVTVRYNEPASQSGTSKAPAAAGDDWRPGTVLHCLLVLKLLQDNWNLLKEPERLKIVADLAGFLRDLLSPPPAARALKVEVTPIVDQFAVVPGGKPDPGDRHVMKTIHADWTKANSAATLFAQAEVPGNSAFVTGLNPVRNYRASLRLLRNESFGKAAPLPADKRLIYECAPVESALECWAHNLWVPPACGPLTFATAGQTLKSALTQFFTGIFNNSDLSSFLLEVGTSLSWGKGSLSVVTPFSILPTDIIPGAGSAVAVADFVFTKCDLLLGPNVPPDVEKISIRLRVKLSEQPDTGKTSSGRTLLEIAAIDFPLTAAAPLSPSGEAKKQEHLRRSAKGSGRSKGKVWQNEA
jgi:hypothetical protein